MSITDVRTKINTILNEDADLVSYAITWGLFLWWCIHKARTNSFETDFSEFEKALQADPNLRNDPDFMAVYENLKAFEERKRYPEEVNEINMKIARSFQRIKKRYPKFWAQAEARAKAKVNHT